jgi:hypothetical protein
MNEIIAFFAKYGLILTLIAVVGVIILGIMKYCNLFKKLPEKSRQSDTYNASRALFERQDRRSSRLCRKR